MPPYSCTDTLTLSVVIVQGMMSHGDDHVMNDCMEVVFIGHELMLLSQVKTSPGTVIPSTRTRWYIDLDLSDSRPVRNNCVLFQPCAIFLAINVVKEDK